MKKFILIITILLLLASPIMAQNKTIEEVYLEGLIETVAEISYVSANITEQINNVLYYYFEDEEVESVISFLYNLMNYLDRKSMKLFTYAENSSNTLRINFTDIMIKTFKKYPDNYVSFFE